MSSTGNETGIIVRCECSVRKLEPGLLQRQFLDLVSVESVDLFDGAPLTVLFGTSGRKKYVIVQE